MIKLYQNTCHNNHELYLHYQGHDIERVLKFFDGITQWYMEEFILEIDGKLYHDEKLYKYLIKNKVEFSKKPPRGRTVGTKNKT